jgi:hypothetical protein
MNRVAFFYGGHFTEVKKYCIKEMVFVISFLSKPYDPANEKNYRCQPVAYDVPGILHWSACM